MSRADYSIEQLDRAIGAVGIGRGDTVSLQVSLGRLGRLEGASGFRAIADAIIDRFLAAVGDEGTLIVPTYTYSIGRGETFDVEHTPSAIGEFPEIFRKRTNAIRSADPMMSTAGIGLKAGAVLRHISKSCYGDGSVFDNLTRQDAKICTLGLGLWWATYCHYVDRAADVPFRFDKEFTGTVRENGIERTETWTYFAAYPLPNCAPNSPAIEQKLSDAGLVRSVELGRASVLAIRARDYLQCGLIELAKNPWLTAMGPPVDRSLCIAAEEEAAAKKQQSANS